VTLGRDNICFVHDGKGKYSKDYKVIKSQTVSRKPDDNPQGKRKDGTPLWCAVANAPQGTVCGWADAQGNCMYEYGGQAHKADDFLYVLGTEYDPDPQDSERPIRSYFKELEKP